MRTPPATHGWAATFLSMNTPDATPKQTDREPHGRIVTTVA